VLRYGDYSRLGESIYDHPFQWGSKRTGPDLARESGKRSDKWHYEHMLDPRMNPGSRMPAYPWLFTKKTDVQALPGKIAVQRKVGVPYDPMTPNEIIDSAKKQAIDIAQGLVSGDDGVKVTKADGTEPQTREEAAAYLAERQIVALIAYLQKLGVYDEVPKKEKPEIPGPLDFDVPDNFKRFSEKPAAAPVTAAVQP
jgi:cytochrome c oxidase cbb3-type subunit I/II